ncbi:MAG: hypothetical protein ACI9AQ_001959 [Dinoroseobacter sp.]|jgi:hypothetical protein
MFGLFSLFGRTTALDSALREAGIHPVLVPEAVKLTIIRMHKREAGDRRTEPSYAEAVDLLAYCMLGRAEFIESNNLPAADRAEDRIEAAIDAGDSADAKLILLALHSGVITDEIADQFDVGDNS